jgi:hypothetical protein
MTRLTAAVLCAVLACATTEIGAEKPKEKVPKTKRPQVGEDGWDPVPRPFTEKECREHEKQFVAPLARKHQIYRSNEKVVAAKFSNEEIQAVKWLHIWVAVTLRGNLKTDVNKMKILELFQKRFPKQTDGAYYEWWLEAFIWEARSANAELAKTLPGLPLRSPP